MYLSDACTLPVNMAGLPGVSIPCGLSEGLPVGLQLIGAAWSEASLFGLARGYEAITAGEAWRGMEPADLAAAADPATPTPAERMAALAGAVDRLAEVSRRPAARGLAPGRRCFRRRRVEHHVDWVKPASRNDRIESAISSAIRR